MDGRRAVGVLVTVLLISVAHTAFAQVDPGTPGPYAVSVDEYNFGDTAFHPSQSQYAPGVEDKGRVWYPTDLSSGPFPFILFLHGRHATCFQGSTAFLEWPCSPGRTPIPSYQGYDYVASILASNGYIVVSIGANGINTHDNGVFDLGAIARAELIQHHLDTWNTFNTTGGPPFDSRFVGAVNLQNVGTMGHSRGGEGVVQQVQLNASLGSPYGINAVLPLAPVDFTRPVLNQVPLAVPLSYCDGDVNDLQGVHYFDDARYNVPGDPAPKHVILVKGGNHNFYNTVWTPGGPPGAADDWTAFTPGGGSDPYCGTVPGNHRLTPAQQRGAGLAYMSAFFRVYIGGETQFSPLLRGDAPPPPSAMTNEIVVSYHPADDPATRLDVNRMLDGSSLTTNTLGGIVVQSGLAPYDVCGGDSPEPQHCLPTPPQPTMRQPHTTPSARSSKRGLSQLTLGWSAGTATYENDLPPGTNDVSAFQVLQFRAAVNFTDARNVPGAPQDFLITLTDGSGGTATTAVSASSPNLYYPPGGPAVMPLPKVILNTVRIPLASFAGIDLTSVQSVVFRFAAPAQGALLISDIAFADSQ